jgi:hypothetical protein
LITIKPAFIGYLATALLLVLYLREGSIRRELERKITDCTATRIEVATPDRRSTSSGQSDFGETIFRGDLSDFEDQKPAMSARPFKEAKRLGVNSQLKRIELYTDLSERQREELELLFKQQERLRQSDLSDEEYEEELNRLPKLGDIIGQEAADAYQQSKSESLKRFRSQSREKELLMLGKKLALSAEQEPQVRSVLDAVEAEVALGEPRRPPRNPKELFGLIRKQSEKRTQLIGEKLKGVLTAEQYQGLAEYLNSTPEAELASWQSQE